MNTHNFSRRFVMWLAIMFCASAPLSLALDDNAKTRAQDAQRLADAKVAKITADLAIIQNTFDEAQKRAKDSEGAIKKAEALRATKQKVQNDPKLDLDDRERTLRKIERAESLISGDRERAASAAAEAKTAAFNIQQANAELARAKKESNAAAEDVRTLKWLCNFAHEYHDDPNDCSHPKMGGQWVHAK